METTGFPQTEAQHLGQLRQETSISPLLDTHAFSPFRLDQVFLPLPPPTTTLFRLGSQGVVKLTALAGLAALMGVLRARNLCPHHKTSRPSWAMPT